MMEPSRDYPTPYPGKARQRPFTRLSTKEQENKASNGLNGATAVARRKNQYVLSVSRSANTLDLSVNDKPSKPSRRLSVPSKYATPVSKNENREVVPSISENKSTASKPSPMYGGALIKARKDLEIEDKAKASAKTLPDSSAKAEGKADGVDKDTLSSPAWSGRSSAIQLENSNRGQKKKSSTLTSSSYWLTQIKLSECAGMHAVSLGFFRLALMSAAEPFQRLCNELKSYVKRHNVLQLESDAKDVLESYGILQEVMSSEIDGQLAVAEDVENGSLVESKGFMTCINEVCSFVSENCEEKSSGVNNDESSKALENKCETIVDTSRLRTLSEVKDVLEPSSEESEICSLKIVDGEAVRGDDNKQEIVQEVRSKPKVLSNKANLTEKKGMTTGNGSIPSRKKVIQKKTTSLNVPAIQSQISVVTKSLGGEYEEQTIVPSTSHCRTSHSCTIITTKNEPCERKDYKQQDNRGDGLSQSGLSSSVENGMEERNENMGSQHIVKLSKHEDLKDLPNDNLLNSTIPDNDFDIRNMSVDTLMDEVVSCIMSSMDDCTDPVEEVSVKSLEDNNGHSSCAISLISTEKITLKEGLTVSVTDTIDGIVRESHVGTISLSGRKEEPVENLKGIASSEDGYGEEIGENAYTVMEEREEKHTDIDIKDTMQLGAVEPEVCKAKIWVSPSKSEVKALERGSLDSKKITGVAGKRKGQQKIVASLDKENTINESCRMPFTKSGSKQGLVKEVKGHAKTNEDCGNLTQNSGAIRHSTRLKGRGAC